MREKRSIQEYDVIPERENGHGIHIALGLALLALVVGYWYFQPVAPSLQARDISIQGIHLGLGYQDLIKQRGKAGGDQQLPDGSRQVVYPSGESYLLTADRVASMAARGTGGLQLAHSEVKVGDSRDSIEKLLGVVDPTRAPGLSLVTWPGSDCRVTVEFDKDWKARAFRVYSP